MHILAVLQNALRRSLLIVRYMLRARNPVMFAGGASDIIRIKYKRVVRPHVGSFLA